jgi:hypothetical protein
MSLKCRFDIRAMFDFGFTRGRVINESACESVQKSTFIDMMAEFSGVVHHCME